jgi:hypothetical protein
VLPNEKQGKTDFSTFLFTEMAKYGGSNIPPASILESGITNYVYSEDNDGFQVLCHGNKIAVLCGVFRSHFGDPALIRTNSDGLELFAYTANQTGLAINCALHGATNGYLTQLAVVKPGALK